MDLRRTQLDISQTIENKSQKIAEENQREFNLNLDSFKRILSIYFPDLDLSTVAFRGNWSDYPYCIINGCVFSVHAHRTPYFTLGLEMTYITKFWFFKTKHIVKFTGYCTEKQYFSYTSDQSILSDLKKIDKIFKNPKRIDMEYGNG